MSEENVDLARQLIEALSCRDLAAMTDRFNPEIEWMPVGPASVERAVYRGRDGVSDGFAATWETWEVFRLEEHEARDLGDSVLWLGRAHLTGGASHQELDQEFAVRLLIDGGDFVRIEGFRTCGRPSKPPGSRSRPSIRSDSFGAAPSVASGGTQEDSSGSTLPR